MLEVATNFGRLEYNTALFDADTARALADGYVELITVAAAAPGTRVSALPVPAGLLSKRTPTGPDRGSPAGPDSAPPAGPDSGSPAGDARIYVAPRTTAEELVAEVWAEVLGVERVGALDDFFDLGGHSLLALRVIGRLAVVAEIDLPIQAFFADTTVAGVAAELERLLTAEIDELTEDEARRLLDDDGRLA